MNSKIERRSVGIVFLYIRKTQCPQLANEVKDFQSVQSDQSQVADSMTNPPHCIDWCGFLFSLWKVKIYTTTTTTKNTTLCCIRLCLDFIFLCCCCCCCCVGFNIFLYFAVIKIVRFCSSVLKADYMPIDKGHFQVLLLCWFVYRQTYCVWM